MQLRKILDEKKFGNEIISVPSGTTVKETAKILCQHKIGALLVYEQNSNPKKYEGIVSERDILNCFSTDEGCSDRNVSDIMTKDMIIAMIDDNVEYVMQIMNQKNIRHIPVIEESKITGLLSIRDIVNSMLKDKEIKFTYLSDFIGTYGNEVF